MNNMKNKYVGRWITNHDNLLNFPGKEKFREYSLWVSLPELSIESLSLQKKSLHVTVKNSFVHKLIIVLFVVSDTMLVGGKPFKLQWMYGNFAEFEPL